MYGEVVLARRKADDKQFAIKIMDKKFMAKQKKQYQVFIEREMLFNLRHPGVMQLYQTFQNSDKLYFVIEYMEFGDFSEFLRANQGNARLSYSRAPQPVPHPVLRRLARAHPRVPAHPGHRAQGPQA